MDGGRVSVLFYCLGWFLCVFFLFGSALSCDGRASTGEADVFTLQADTHRKLLSVVCAQRGLHASASTHAAQLAPFCHGSPFHPCDFKLSLYLKKKKKKKQKQPQPCLETHLNEYGSVCGQLQVKQGHGTRTRGSCFHAAASLRGRWLGGHRS